MKKLKFNNYFFINSLLSFFALFMFLFIVVSCGKKGEPTLKSFEKPETPANLRAIKRTDEIILNWNFPAKKESEIKGFNIFRSSLNPSNTGKEEWTDFVKIAFIDKKIRTYIDSSIEENSSYKYKIISQNLKDILSKESNIIQVSSVKLPEPPSQLSFRIENDKQILTWKETVPDSLHNIYRYDINRISQIEKVNITPIKGYSFTDYFNINKTYCYIIRTISGNEVIYESKPSEEICIKPAELIPSKPLNLQATALADSVVLVWQEPNETFVTGYKIYREIDKKKGFLLIGESRIPSFTDKEKASTKRNYRVTAVGPIKEGPEAEIRDIIYIKPR